MDLLEKRSKSEKYLYLLIRGSFDKIGIVK